MRCVGERKSEGEEKSFSLVPGAKANAECAFVFRSFRAFHPLPYGAVMYGFMNGGFTYFSRLKWREGGRERLKGKVARARAVSLLVRRPQR